MPNVSTTVSSIAYQNSPSPWQAPAQQPAAPLVRPGGLIPLDQLNRQRHPKRPDDERESEERVISWRRRDP